MAKFLIGQFYNITEAGKTLDQIIDDAIKYGCDGVRLSAQVSSTVALDYALMDKLLDDLHARGMTVLLNPFHNFNSHAGYYGSADWFNKWIQIAAHYKNDARIWAFQLWNEASPNVISPSIPNTPQSIQAAQAKCIDLIRALGDNHPILLTANENYANYGWTLYPESVRPNTLQSVHFTPSLYAQTTFGTGAKEWAWCRDKIISFEQRYPHVPCVVDELSIVQPTSDPNGGASWDFQYEAMLNAINWCVETNHDFGWWRWGYGLNTTGWYVGKPQQILTDSIYPKPGGGAPTCPTGYHWDPVMQACEPDVFLYKIVVTTDGNGQTVPAEGTYQASSGTYSFKAVPKTGFQFSHWLYDGLTVTDNPITVPVDGDHNLEAFFTVITTPPPAKATFAARVPMMPILALQLCRKARDALLTEEHHKKLHPLV
jgi:hypothetical protein